MKQHNVMFDDLFNTHKKGNSVFLNKYIIVCVIYGEVIKKCNSLSTLQFLKQ